MKPLEFEIEVTAEAIGRVESDMREALRIARHEHFARRRRYIGYLRFIGLAAATVGLLLSLLLMFKSLAWSYAAAFCLCGALLFTIPEKRLERLVQSMNNWTLRYSLRRLMQAAPYIARYRLDENAIETRIEKFKIERRRPWTRVAKVFLGDHAVVLLTRGYPQRPMFILPASLEQYKQIETLFRAYKLEVVSLPPKFVPQAEKGSI